MNLTETAAVLAKAAAFDRRTVGDADILAWQEALADVDVADALVAVTAHYREQTEWLMPAHIREHAAQLARERHRIAREAAEHEAAEQQALEAGHTEDRSDAVVDLVAEMRARIPKGDPRKLRPRAHYWRQQQRSNAPAEPNPHFRGFPPPGGFPTPDDEPGSLGDAIMDTFATGWPEDDQRRTS